MVCDQSLSACFSPSRNVT